MNKEKLKQTGKIVGNILSWILITLTVIILVFTAINVKNPGKMSLFGLRIGVVGSPSMEPTIDVNDFIVYKNYDFNKVEKNDIIVFRYIGDNEKLKGQQIVHRVIEINPDGSLVTKGDNPKVFKDNEVVTEDNFIGKCVLHTSLFGLAKLRSGGMSFIFLLLTIVFVILIISSIVSITKELTKAKKEKVKQEIIDQYEKEKALEKEQEKVNEEKEND